MSSVQLGSGFNIQKGNLGGAFDILSGASGDYTDLGIARRFGGSAAAYSLRDIGAMNGPVVKVRREPQDTTDAIDDEQNFSASQVASGALEDWVNGKFENTLPADVATAAAAYSLRKVKSDYAGNAVRIRRTDNIEVNVGFDSEGKVSASSSISNVVENSSSSDISSTTLGEFINGTNAFVHTWYDQTEDTTVTGNEYTSSFGSGDFDTFGDNGLDNTARTNPVQGLGGFDGFALHLKVSDASQAFQVSSLGSRSYSAGDGLRFKLGLYMPSSNTDLRKIKVYTDGSNGSKRTMGGEYLRPALDQWVDYEFTDIAESNIIGFRFVQDDGTLGECAVGDEVYVRLIVIDAITKAGNNLTQGTSANQPKIAESGTLLTDGVEFDGSASYLDAISALGATSTIGAFIVHKPDDTDENQYLIDNRDGTSDGMRIMQRSDGDGNYRFSMDSTNVNSASGSVATNETLLTAIQSSTAATLFKNSAQQATAADDAISVTAAFRIGANRVSTGTYFDGTMKEIILFTSDQTDNRFKIESNINNYYSLYNDDNEQQSAQFSTAGGTADTSEALRNKFGFTGSGGAGGATGFFGIRLKYKVFDTKTIHISFNSTKASSSSSFGVGLYRDSIGGTLSQSTVTPIVKGFNSLTLTSNNDTAEYISFSEDDEVAFTVSDFRVSRIERNGYVETWYNQNGNGFDLNQNTADNQPEIVLNGGQIKLNGGSPCIAGSRRLVNARREFDATSDANAISQPFTNFQIVNSRRSAAGYVWGDNATSSGGAPRLEMKSTFIRQTYSATDNPAGVTIDGDVDQVISVFSAAASGNAIIRRNATQIQSAARSVYDDTDNVGGVFRFPGDDSNPMNVILLETLMFFNGDLSADFAVIEKELALPVGIDI
jgi:hypothetical protein